MSKELPESLSDKYEKDVSEEYFPNERIAVRCENIPKGTNIAYLCLFNNQSWIPVDWSEIKNDTARFEHMDWRNIVYTVGYYKNAKIIPATVPILTTELAKHAILLHPNMQKKNTIRVERKFPENYNLIFLRDILINGRFQGSNCPDFKNAVDIYTITQRPPGSYLKIKLDTIYKFRYVRFLAKKGIRSDISELEFYSPSDSILPLKGNPMGNPPEKGTIAHQKSETNISLFFNCRTFDTGIIQSRSQAVDFTVTTGEVVVIDRTTVHAQIHQIVRCTLKSKCFFRKRHNDL